MKKSAIRKEKEINTREITETGGRLIGLVAKRIVLSIIERTEKPKRVGNRAKRISNSRR